MNCINAVKNLKIHPEIKFWLLQPPVIPFRTNFYMPQEAFCLGSESGYENPRFICLEDELKFNEYK